MTGPAVQQALRLLRNEPVEVQDEFAALLLAKLAPSSGRRWRGASLLCFKEPAADGSDRQPEDADGTPISSRHLQRALKAVVRQPPVLWPQAVEALEQASLALRLRGLPDDIRLLVACHMGRMARCLCRAFLHAHAPLRCGLRLEDTPALCAFNEQMNLGGSSPHLSSVTALVLGPRAPLLDPTTIRTLSDLQVAAIRALPDLAALTLLPGAAPTDELLAALPPMATRLTALTLPCLPQLSTSNCLRPLTLLRSLSLTPTPCPPGAPPPPPTNPHALLGPLRRMRHLQALHLDLQHPSDPPQPDPDWLIALAALTALTHLTLYPWMTPWDADGLRLLRDAWPPLASLALHLSLPEDAAAASTLQGLAAALAARTALVALRLRVAAGGVPPLHRALAPLAALTELEFEDSCWRDRTPLDRAPDSTAAGELLCAVAQHPGVLARLLLRAPLQGTMPGTKGSHGGIGSSGGNGKGTGSITGSDGSSSAGRLLSVQPLPQLAAVGAQLVVVEMWPLPCALGAALAAAAGGAMPRLRELRLLLLGPVVGRNPWDDACVALLARLTQLHSLRLADERHLPGCVVPAVACLTGLQSLSLVSLHRGTRDTPRLQGSHLKPLAALAALSSLELVGFHEVRGRALTVLRRLPRLEWLRLEGLPEVELFCHTLDAYLVPLPPALRLLHLHTVALSAEARDALAAAAVRHNCRLVVERCWLRDEE